MCTQKMIQGYQPFVPLSDQPALGGDGGWKEVKGGQHVHTASDPMVSTVLAII